MHVILVIKTVTTTRSNHLKTMGSPFLVQTVTVTPRRAICVVLRNKVGYTDDNERRFSTHNCRSSLCSCNDRLNPQGATALLLSGS